MGLPVRSPGVPRVASLLGQHPIDLLAGLGEDLRGSGDLCWVVKLADLPDGRAELFALGPQSCRLVALIRLAAVPGAAPLFALLLDQRLAGRRQRKMFLPSCLTGPTSPSLASRFKTG